MVYLVCLTWLISKEVQRHFPMSFMPFHHTICKTGIYHISMNILTICCLARQYFSSYQWWYYTYMPTGIILHLAK